MKTVIDKEVVIVIKFIVNKINIINSALANCFLKALTNKQIMVLIDFVPNCRNCTTEILLIAFKLICCSRRILFLRVLVLALNDRSRSAAEQFSLL
jgi:hypothetical protein